METIETLQEISDEFSETMIIEFADNECALGNRLVVGYLERAKYTKEQIELLRKVIFMDTERNGW